MGKNNTNSRGFSSNTLRKFKIEMLKKSINRKQNISGSTARSKRVNGKG